MPQFEFTEQKKPHELLPEDHIIHKDRFYRIVKNYSVLGYPAQTRRMLMIVPEQFLSPTSFQFLEITTESRIAAYLRHE